MRLSTWMRKAGFGLVALCAALTPALLLFARAARLKEAPLVDQVAADDATAVVEEVAES